MCLFDSKCTQVVSFVYDGNHAEDRGGHVLI